ncbi:hypothetical protein MUB24_08025 [Lederbergia sp. NSJ-179]|uniref:hypothetical protein n=1 Tax=Lederbergia sp. NSJ-179 TaxID=2931402 RepID=UPI001FCFE708|nr:hypothetical protein [Lederbergia sp. NSJ-179]MCJ7840851.1 hypothetical protein [Lederbergia sp. NSJ-179]
MSIEHGTRKAKQDISVPQPILIGKIDISAAGKNTKMYVGDLTGDGRMDILMVQPDGGIDDRYVPHQVQSMTAFDLEGRILWKKGEPDPNPGGPGSDYPVQIYDIDGDGQNEVLSVIDKKFHILEGSTGKVKNVFDLPSEYAHDCIIIANLTGGKFPQDIILKDRYEQLWAMDKHFNQLWTYKGNPGHFPWVFDFNGDGRDEVMAGYDFLNADGEKVWSCIDLEDHADCIWVGKVNKEISNEYQIVIGGSVTVMYDQYGKELWRYEGSVESQHVSLGKFRDDLPGLQIAGLDRIVRGNENGKDGLFLLDANGKEIWKEDRKTKGWLTIIETMRNWDDHELDYILAYRRGGGIKPTLYDGYMNPVVQFPEDGYVVHADLFGNGYENVMVYNDQTAYIYASRPTPLSKFKESVLAQEKRLYSVTLYPGGEYVEK